MTAQHLEDEDLGGGLGHRAHVVARLADRDRRVLRDGPEPRAAIRQRQVVVHRLGDVDRLDRIAKLVAQLRHLETGVGRVPAAVVEEIADVMGPEDFDQPLILGEIRVEALQLVAARPERPTGGVAQRGDGRVRFSRCVDQVFGERADDAVAAGVYLADPVRMLARRLDHALRRDIDDGGDPARLGVERVTRHGMTQF